MTDVSAVGSSSPLDNTAGRAETQAERTRPKRTSSHRRIGAFLFSLVVTLVLFIGWRQRGEEYLTAESGWGYALGIIGATFMLLLSFYPLRKRLKFMRRWGAVAHWFRLHMILGVIGPALIFFHANFKLGSKNSTIALVAMLLVVASGLVGRFIYAKVHHGLYGRNATLKELRQDVEALRDFLVSDLEEAEGIKNHLARFEEKVLAPRQGVLRNAWLLLTLGVRARRARRLTLRHLKGVFKREAERRGWSGRRRRRHWKTTGNHACNHVDLYLTTVQKVAEFAFYERVFALWHVLHLPLYYILFLATIVHIVAVHLY